MAENTNTPFFDELVKRSPKYKLGKRKGTIKAHNKNGKIAFTTTLLPSLYEWLKVQSAKTGKSGSDIINELLSNAATNK